MTYYVKHISHVLLALSIISLSTTASAGSNNGGAVNTNLLIVPLTPYAMGNLSAVKKSYKTGPGYVSTANARWSAMLGKDEDKK